MKKKKSYSTYNNHKSNLYNKIPVQKGDIIVSKLSDYYKLPKNIMDHKKEAVVIIVEPNSNLGVVHLHGIKDVNGNDRKNKVDRGIWLEAVKDNGEVVLVDLNIIDKDKNGKPIRQGNTFMRTQRKFKDKEMKKIEDHLLNNKGRKHDVRRQITNNKIKFFGK